MALLARLFAALLAVPLFLSKPFFRLTAQRRRQARVLRGRLAAGGQPPKASRPRRASAAEVRAMVEALGAVLDEHKESRQVFRHVARFERKLAKSGLRVVDELPVEQLRRALREFEAMVRNWSSVPLADLRSRMAVTLAERASASTVWIAANSVAAARSVFGMNAAPKGFRASQQLDIGDVSISRFEAAGGRWGADSRSGAPA